MSYQKTKPLLVTPPRRDGWTADRQLRFLTVLTHTRSVSLAVTAAGMSRESAYRLRARDPHGLFAYMWKKAMQPGGYLGGGEVDQGHKAVTFLVRATEGKCHPQDAAALSTL